MIDGFTSAGKLNQRTQQIEIRDCAEWPDVVYVLIGSNDKVLYVGETGRKLKSRIVEYNNWFAERGSWGPWQAQQRERFRTVFRKCRSVMLLAKRADSVIGRISGKPISLRHVEEQDLITAFGPQLNVKGK